MRNTLTIIGLSALLVSCGDQKEISIHVTETRALTMHDIRYPGNLKDHPPLGWRRLPGTQFRALNYRAGADESVEIVLGETQGEVLENANRWLGQFGLTPLQSDEFLGKIQMLGRQAFIVEGEGTYNPGMGQPRAENYAMIGLIRPSGSNIISLKMTGPMEEVEKLRQEFFDYADAFTPIDEHFIEKPGETKPGGNS